MRLMLDKNGNRQSGFTLIELFVVLVIIGILVTLVALTFNGVQAKNRNGQRKVDIDTIQGELESYYAQFSAYPTLSNLNSPSWLAKNISDLQTGDLQDPHWSTKTKNCTEDGHSILINKVATNCFTYQPVSTDGSVCNNVLKACAHYTLTAVLEGGGVKYVKSSLN